LVGLADSLSLVGEAAMAQRQIGQEAFRFGADTGLRRSSLDELGELIDWSIVSEVLAPIYNAPQGEKGWPPLALFKALLLAVWYDLSDVALAGSLADRASFRRFCGFARDEATPERTSFVRFRGVLVARGLDRTLFDGITLQLETKGAAVRKGTLIDATIIGSASKHDTEAAWVKQRNRNRPAVHGYKAHVAADKDTGLIREVVVTPANLADVSIAPDILPWEPGEVYGDRAYDADWLRQDIIAAGGTPCLLSKLTQKRDSAAVAAHNRPLQAIRARVEKIFGTWKRTYRFRHMRWLGLAKAALQVHLTAIAYNYKRYWRLQAA
jgi:transposase, IS5 family